jgi:hypothetical protein
MIKKTGIEDIISKREAEKEHKEQEALEKRQKALKVLWGNGEENDAYDEWAATLDQGELPGGGSDGYNSPGGSSDGYNSPGD